MSNVRIEFVGGDEPKEFAALHSWLRADRELRGCVQQRRRPAETEDLGGVLEAITAALGTAAATMALAERLATWLQSRRSTVKLTITNDDGRTVTVDTKDPAKASTIITEFFQDGRDD